MRFNLCLHFSCSFSFQTLVIRSVCADRYMSCGTSWGHLREQASCLVEREGRLYQILAACFWAGSQVPGIWYFLRCVCVCKSTVSKRVAKLGFHWVSIQFPLSLQLPLTSLHHTRHISIYCCITSRASGFRRSISIWSRAETGEFPSTDPDGISMGYWKPRQSSPNHFHPFPIFPLKSLKTLKQRNPQKSSILSGSTRSSAFQRSWDARDAPPSVDCVWCSGLSQKKPKALSCRCPKRSPAQNERSSLSKIVQVNNRFTVCVCVCRCLHTERDIGQFIKGLGFLRQMLKVWHQTDEQLPPKITKLHQMKPGTRFCGQIEAAEHIDFQDFSGLPCWCRSGKWPWSIRFTATLQSRKTHESKTGLQKLMKRITHRNAVNLIRRMSFQCLVFTCFERRMSFWSFFLCLDVQLKWAYWTRWTLLLEKDLAPKSMLKTLFPACTAEALAKQEPPFWNSQCAVAQLSMQNQYLSMVCAYIAIKSVEIRWIDWNHTGPKHAALEAFVPSSSMKSIHKSPKHLTSTGAFFSSLGQEHRDQLATISSGARLKLQTYHPRAKSKLLCRRQRKMSSSPCRAGADHRMLPS